MSKKYWLPATVTRQHEDVAFLFETLIYGFEVERPVGVDQETAERWIKDDLAALQSVRRYRREAHGYDILMETLSADPALDAEERLVAKQKQILEMAYRAKELCDEHRAQEEAEEEDEDEE
nr:MAG TPA: hypothetical protein [Caudoviricetes sp.]